MHAPAVRPIHPQADKIDSEPASAQNWHKRHQRELASAYAAPRARMHACQGSAKQTMHTHTHAYGNNAQVAPSTGLDRKEGLLKECKRLMQLAQCALSACMRAAPGAKGTEELQVTSKVVCMKYLAASVASKGSPPNTLSTPHLTQTTHTTPLTTTTSLIQSIQSHKVPSMKSSGRIWAACDHVTSGWRHTTYPSQREGATWQLRRRASPAAPKSIQSKTY